MNATSIEWVKNPDGSQQGYTLNSKTGCLNGCEYCYAHKLANRRLRDRYLKNTIFPDINNREYRKALADPFYPRFWPTRLEQIRQRKKPAGIFLDDMSDWMGSYWPEEWTKQELQVMRDCPQHRFYTLTKQSQNLIKFSPFPSNCWVGVTATEQHYFVRATSELRFIVAKIKYLSFEPLLGHIPMLPEALTLAGIDWVIIGAMTGRRNELIELNKQYPDLTLLRYGRIWTLQPKLEWVLEIVKAADKTHIPVFLKLNLVPGIADSLNPEKIKLRDRGVWLRQEMPK